jgi:uncharacterized protein YndB with AHSA1/START domain
MILRARVSASVADTWHALTDAAALRTWLAESADVALPDRYEFWGRYTPEGDKPHQRLLHADGNTLRYGWMLDGLETTTEIRLDENGGGSTIVTISQDGFSFAEAMSGSTVRGVLQTFWSLSVANLAAYLAGEPLTPKCDFTSGDLRGEILIDASADAVYESLTDSEQVSRWFGYPVGIEPYVGGRFAMGGFDAGHAAKVVDVDPGRKMSVDWGPQGVTTWELESSGGKTRLTFVQSGFSTPEPPYGAWTGWLGGLSELRRFHEVPDWRPIWVSYSMPA